MKRYIKKVTLENYQAYTNETIDFTEGLNILEGTSDAGKSSILRAISLVLHNAPYKHTFIQYGAEELSVTLEFSDGVKVKRIRGKDVNVVEAVDASGKTYEKVNFDKEYPEDIIKLLGNPPEDDYNGFISYADQFSPLFLINLNQSDLPRALSSLTGVHFLEETAKLLMQNYRAIDKQNKVDSKDHKSLQEELVNYDFVDDAESKLQNAQNLLNKISILETKKSDLEKFLPFSKMTVDESVLKKHANDLSKSKLSQEKLKTIAEIQNKIANLEKYTEPAKIQVTDKTIEEYEQMLKKANSANNLRVKISSLIERQNSLKVYQIISGSSYNENYQAKVQKIYDNSVKAKDILVDLTEWIKKLNSLKSYSEKLSEFEQNCKRQNTEYEVIKKEQAKAQEEFDVFKQLLVDKKIKCDKCGSFISEGQ